MSVGLIRRNEDLAMASFSEKKKMNGEQKALYVCL